MVNVITCNGDILATYKLETNPEMQLSSPWNQQAYSSCRLWVTSWLWSCSGYGLVWLTVLMTNLSLKTCLIQQRHFQRYVKFNIYLMPASTCKHCYMSEKTCNTMTWHSIHWYEWNSTALHLSVVWSLMHEQQSQHRKRSRPKPKATDDIFCFDNFSFCLLNFKIRLIFKIAAV